jgi:hypothetical protein
MAFLIPENLRTRPDVPAGVNRTGRVLHQALADAVTVWYEPLFDNRGDRPDLVALVPDAGVLVLEVLEKTTGAVRGVRNGRLLVRKGGAEQEADDPLSRAEAFAARLRELLGTEPRLAPEERLPVVAVGVFPYLARDEGGRRRLGEVVDLGQCLFRDECEAGLVDPAGFERRLLGLFGGTLRDPLTAEAERVHRALIHPDTVIGTPQLPFPTATPEDEFKVLDREQEAVAKGLGEGHRVVRGVAGSGKTLVLTYRARLLAEAFPEHRVLVTCFNRALAASLRRQLPLGNVRVRTIEALMQRVRDAAGMPEMPYDATTMEERAEAALEALDQEPRAAGRFDHVMVDEAQDFATPALRFAVRLLKPSSDSLLVVADAAQNIYGQTFRWKDAGINAVGRTRVLDTGYRNTREILEYAHDFLVRSNEFRVDADADPEDETVLVAPRFSTRSGPVPLTARADSPQEEVLYIAEHCRGLLDRGVEPGAVAVLYGSRTAGGFWWPDAIRKAFAEAGLPVFWATDPDDRSQRDRLGADRSEIVLSTIHSAKGLEFAHVVLCGFLDDKPSEQSVLNRRLIYVGMTRATHELVVTFSGKHPYIADLEQ